MNRKMAMLALPAVGFVLLAAAAAREGKSEGQWYKADLQAVNDSGVQGTAWFHLKGDQLKVDVKATGLAPNQPHPMHLHGFTEAGKASSCPSAAADMNKDGTIALDEIQQYVGRSLVELEGAKVDDNGTLKFKKTVKVDPSKIEPLDMRTVAIHGMKVKGSYEASTPAACGKLQVSQYKGMEF